MKAFMFYDYLGDKSLSARTFTRLKNEKDYELLRPFDISLDLRFLTVPTNDLAKIVLEGGLPSLKLYLTKEKLLNLIDLLDVISGSEGAGKVGVYLLLTIVDSPEIT